MMTEAKGSEVVLVHDLGQVAEILLRERPGSDLAQVSDPAEVATDIVRRILTSEGEQALAQRTTTKAAEVLDKPLEIRAVRWLRSGIEDNPIGIYALVDAVDLGNGEELLVTCGGQNVMAQLLVLDRDESLPIKAYLEQMPETQRGFRPLWLRPVETPAA
jgi:hypothetical protein